MYKTQRDRDCTFEEANDAPWVRSKSVHSRFGNLDHIIRFPKGSHARFSSIADAQRIGWIRGWIRHKEGKPVQLLWWSRRDLLALTEVASVEL